MEKKSSGNRDRSARSLTRPKRKLATFHLQPSHERDRIGSDNIKSINSSSESREIFIEVKDESEESGPKLIEVAESIDIVTTDEQDDDNSVSEEVEELTIRKPRYVGKIAKMMTMKVEKSLC